MKKMYLETKRLLLTLFFVLGVLFILGATFEIKSFFIVGNFFMAPFLFLYYRLKTQRLFLPVVGVLLLFYIRDIFLYYGLQNNQEIIWICYLLAMLLQFLCLVTGFQRSKVHPVEILSFLIMYGFLAFLFVSLAEVVPHVLPSAKIPGYIYLLLLTLLLGGTFTAYILKSHTASLWFLVAASALLVSEYSLFFKIYIVEDFSVNFFYPFFHVFTYYALIEYALRRRRSGEWGVF